MSDKAMNLLGLMRKANALRIGETDTGAACRADEAKLVCLASDASANALSRAKVFVYGRKISLIRIPFSKEEISDAVGKTGCSMVAICDLGFAEAFLKQLPENEKYSDTEAVISEMLKKEKLRLKEERAHRQNKRTGKRRNNA